MVGNTAFESLLLSSSTVCAAILRGSVYFSLSAIWFPKGPASFWNRSFRSQLFSSVQCHVEDLLTLTMVDSPADVSWPYCFDWTVDCAPARLFIEALVSVISAYAVSLKVAEGEKVDSLPTFFAWAAGLEILTASDELLSLPIIPWKGSQLKDMDALKYFSYAARIEVSISSLLLF